jgi:plastocyanin
MGAILSWQINLELIYLNYNILRKDTFIHNLRPRRAQMKTKLSLILLAVIFLVACGPKTGPTPAGTLPPVQSSKAKVSIAIFAFDPVALTITTGTTVTWTNNDNVAHNIAGDDGSWGSNSLATDDTYSFTFTKSGTFSYHCGIHPSMKATITVVTPYP